jgi:CheY-like chemotaxis protein
MAKGLSDPEQSVHRILVVEDNQPSSKLILKVLKLLGFEDIYCASNGLDAWSYFEDGVLFDLVICDWMMPKMNGLDVLKQLRASHSDIPFIMISAKKSDEDAYLEAKANGVTAFVDKPFEMSDLINAITNSLPRAGGKPANAATLDKSEVWEI